MIQLQLIHLNNEYYPKLFKFRIIFDNNEDKFVSKYPGGSVIWDNKLHPRMSLLNELKI